jgi:predicted AAA+ superfamily ATPase
MVKRELQNPGRSFFLFGPRQTGKSTWIKALTLPDSWTVNLLLNDTYFRYLRKPSQFRLEAEGKIQEGTGWIVVDEIQRIPALLNEIHYLLESFDIRFILSGSSARKLKRVGANMLGGRALLRHMHPFTVRELERDTPEKAFPLEEALIWGTLPPLVKLNAEERSEILNAYVEIYLREEIQQEALVRNLGGFIRFLDITAAYSGEIVNFTSLGKEAGIPTRTVQSYFEVLEDTLILLRLPAWRKSPTKRLLSHPKMYFFDNGVANALCRRLRAPVDPTLKGRLFEQFMIQETRRRLDYSGLDYALYYWRTNNGAEVDLLIELNGQLARAVEFKSKTSLDRSDITGLSSFHEDNPGVKCHIVSMAPEPFSIDFVSLLPWKDYLDLLDQLE